MRLTRRGWLAATAGILAGCNSATTTAPTVSSPSVGPIELTPVSARGLDTALGELRGKVVLVDVWFLG